MRYMGFLCLGLGILSLVIGMIGGLLAIASPELTVKIKAKRVAVRVLPLAFLLLMIGFGLTFAILSPSE